MTIEADRQPRKHIRGVRLHFLPESNGGKPELYQDIEYVKVKWTDPQKNARIPLNAEIHLGKYCYANTSKATSLTNYQKQENDPYCESIVCTDY